MMASSVEVDLLRICCNPVSLPMVRAAVLSAERLTRWMMLPCPLRSESSRVAAAFTVGLYIGLPAGVGLGRRPLGRVGSHRFTHEPFSRGESTSHHDT